MLSMVRAVARRFIKVSGATDRELRMTQLESLACSQVEPECTEVSRAGRRFYGGAQSTATGRAPVVAIPTTAAAWMLWNGEPDGGKSLAIDAVHIVQLSGTSAVGGAVLTALTTTRIAAPTAATGYSVASASRSAIGSKAVWADNQTLAAAPVWGVLDANGNPASTTNGGDSVECKGRIIVPPGFALALHYLSGTGTTPLFLASAWWSELDLDLE